MVRPHSAALLSFALLLTALAHAEKPIRVAVDGSGDYKTVQAAIDHLPDTGGTVLIAPGSYREQVIIRQSHVTLKGTGSGPEAVILVDDTSQGTRGTKPSYATVHVLGDDFHATNLTFQNDFNRTHEQVSAGSQAQALNLEGDRNILSRVRILANQDTLYVGAKGCGQSGSLRRPAPSDTSFPPSASPAPVARPASPCVPTPTRSYFTHCVVAGNVDFIYGDANAVFEDCEIHSTLHAAGGYLTAQGKYLKDQQSTFVFDHCRLTAEPGEQHVFLGRPWRDYASVVYLHCTMGAHIDPAGWREWGPTTHRLETAFYAEYDSTGPGASPSTREPNSHQLTAAQAKAYDPVNLLAGSDHWNPVRLASKMK
ncbi:MAG TPA: pectinesterase family protein [Acidobacteriaceae bacterium]|nr:pectinesterase family protein [Acidobacteriaceae bacterium]